MTRDSNKLLHALRVSFITRLIGHAPSPDQALPRKATPAGPLVELHV